MAVYPVQLSPTTKAFMVGTKATGGRRAVALFWSQGNPVFKRTVPVVLLVFPMLGCEKPKTPAPHEQIAPVIDAPSSQVVDQVTSPPKASNSGTAPEHAISPEKVTALFLTSWVSDDELTQEYDANHDVDQLSEKCWLYCVQLKAKGFFKDDGFRLELKDSELQLVPLDFKDGLNDQMRLIDDQHFALFMKENGFWLVFRDANMKR